MSRRFQFSVRDLLGQMALLGVALVCLQSIGEHAGPAVSAWLLEGAATAMGAAIGLLWRKPIGCAAVAAIVVIPAALFIAIVVEGIGC